MQRSRAILWAAVVVGLIVTAALAWNAGVFNRAPAVAASGVGGPFELVDQAGKPVSEKVLRGKWSAVFFGFTYCPDICPNTLQALMRTKDQLGPLGKDVQIVFISADPGRDTPQVVREWLEAQGAPEGTLGLTGNQAQVDQVLKAYRAVATKDGDGPGYQINHSTVVYLMNPRGEFVKVLHKDLPDEMATQIRDAKRG